MSNEVAEYKPKQRNAMMIKNLCPGLMEMGKIKIGNKGAMRQSSGGASFQAPQKLDHFIITTNERGQDNNFVLDSTLHGMFGESPKSIPVRLIYDDISLNFATRYICYYGKTVFCSGDGEEAQRLQSDKKTYKARPCPCERQDPTFAGDVVNGQVKAGQGKCKINGILSVVIDGAQSVGGVWKFRTTSYNSVVGILSSLALISRITGGRLAGIPMNLTVSPKTVNDPISQKQQTIYVVGLQYAGTMDSLRETGYQIAMDEAKHGISMRRIEEDAMLMLTHNPTSGLGSDSVDDVIGEFYPEEMQSAAIPTLVAAEEKKPAVTAGSPATTGTAPILVAPLKEESVDIETGEVEMSEQEAQEVAAPVEVVETPAEKEKRTRRTKAEIEAAKQAAQPAPVAAIVEDDDFPDPPGTVVAAVQEAAPVQEEAPPVQDDPPSFDDEPGDLF